MTKWQVWWGAYVAVLHQSSYPTGSASGAAVVIHERAVLIADQALSEFTKRFGVSA